MTFLPLSFYFSAINQMEKTDKQAISRMSLRRFGKCEVSRGQEIDSSCVIAIKNKFFPLILTYDENVF